MPTNTGVPLRLVFCTSRQWPYVSSRRYTYDALRTRDKRLHKALCDILKEMLRDDPASGIGKPEALRHGLSGFWSRRLSRNDRVISTFEEHSIYIFAIGGHYEQLTR